MRNQLAGLSVLDETGGTVAMDSLWNQQGVVLVFVRHFGCLFCQEQVSELVAAEEKLRSSNVEVVVVGCGTPNFIQGFRERSGFRGRILTDPQRATFAALNFTRSLTSTFRPATVLGAVRAFRKGHRQTSPQGDVWQQGGVLVVARGGEVVFHYASKYAGDHPPAGKVLQQGQRAGELAA